MKSSEDCQWTFSIDFAWHESTNSVSYLNSFKMKTSIVVGVVHMLFGVLLKGINSLHFQNFSKFFFVFLPEFLFFACTCGYMVFLIVIKWLTPFPDPTQAPSIISVFINFISSVEQPLFGTDDFQYKLQVLLASVAIACVPFMLLGRPITLWFYSKIDSKANRQSTASQYTERECLLNRQWTFLRRKEVFCIPKIAGLRKSSRITKPSTCESTHPSRLSLAKNLFSQKCLLRWQSNFRSRRK